MLCGLQPADDAEYVASLLSGVGIVEHHGMDGVEVVASVRGEKGVGPTSVRLRFPGPSNIAGVKSIGVGLGYLPKLMVASQLFIAG